MLLPQAEGRETSGITTRLIIGYVRRHGGPDAVRDVLRRAGVARTAAELADEATWSSYEEKIRLFEAAADELGDPFVGLHIGASVLDEQVGTPLKLLLRTLGSPGSVLRNVAKTASKFTTCATMEAADVGRHSAALAYRLHPGYEPSRFDCDYNIGLISQVSVLFGLPRARVSHPLCQVNGADRCVYKVWWPARSRLPWRRRAARVRYVEDQLRTSTERAEALISTVADLVSTDRLPSVLARVADRAASAIRAQRYLLAVRPTPDAPLQVHHRGFDDEVAHKVAQLIAAGNTKIERGSTIVVPVASARRTYGWLAASTSEEDAFFPEEERLLAAYAKHAAAALDAATALDESRVRGTTSSILLELGRSLANLTSREQVAERVAATVPYVTGSDRAVVLLWEAGDELLRVGGTYGWEGELADAMRRFSVRPADTPELEAMLGSPRPRFYDRDTDDAFILGALETFDTCRIAVIPITARDAYLGAIVASWSTDEEGASLETHLVDRLQGIADQAGIAIENVRLLEREREISDELRQANRMKSEFLAAVSHEFRTPLAIILGGARTILDHGGELDEPRKRDVLEAIDRHGRRLNRLVEDLLQSSRSIRLRLGRVDVVELVSSETRMLMEMGTDVDIRLEADGSADVVADGDRLQQVLDNLLTNAVRHGHGRNVRVSVGSDGVHGWFTVSDDGPGMTDEQIRRAIEPFWQADASGHRTSGGVGLGLYITQRIAEAHGGTVRIDSTPGTGTTVRVSLPVGGPPVPPPADPDDATLEVRADEGSRRRGR